MKDVNGIYICFDFQKLLKDYERTFENLYKYLKYIKDMGETLDNIYVAIAEENYGTAIRHLMQVSTTRPQDEFNFHSALAVCYFQKFQLGEDTLEWALFHAQKSINIYDRHFDVQLIKAQCLATKYCATNQPEFKKQALATYEECIELSSQRPDLDSDTLKERVRELIAELEGE